ncbi:autotransporter outer membrane beta-barrel domain-containing protein [Bordetella bronchiseptica]|uniref:autotransporter outer membrane beta-barrel domain-containing protein n=1 Tax=Bordetella bronchiseptica TaxID=518 RepID=UPI003F74A859
MTTTPAATSARPTLRRTACFLAAGTLGIPLGAQADWNSQTIRKTSQQDHGIHIQASDASDAAAATNMDIDVSGRYAAGILMEKPGATLTVTGGMVSSSGTLVGAVGTTLREMATVVVKHGTLLMTGTRVTNKNEGATAGSVLDASGADAAVHLVNVPFAAHSAGVSIQDGAQATFTRGDITVQEGYGLHASGSQGAASPTRVEMTGGSVTSKSTSSSAVRVGGHSEFSATSTRIQGAGGGLQVMRGGSVQLDSAVIQDTGQDPASPIAGGWVGLRIDLGHATLAQTTVTARQGGAALDIVDGTFMAKGGMLAAPKGAAIRTSSGFSAANPADASQAAITLQDGARAQGAVLLHHRGTKPFLLTLDSGAQAEGDIVTRLPDDVQVAPPLVPPLYGGAPGRLDMRIAGAAQWRGATSVLNALAIDAGTWTLTASSSLKKLTLGQQGRVVFEHKDGHAYKTLTLATLEGDGGEFQMNSNAAAGQSDQLVVTGSAAGEHRLRVQDSGHEPDNARAVTLVRTPQGSTAAFSLANKDGKVDIGTYRYQLMADGKGNWALAEPPPPAPPVEPEPAPPAPQPEPPVPAPRPPADRELSAAANAAVNTGGVGAASTLWYAENNALSKRLGELRLNPDAGGAWTRGFGQHQQLSNRAGRRFDQKVAGFELGADHAVAVAGGRWHLGGLAGYTRGDRGFTDDGGGHTDSVHVGGYATYIANSGFYLDATLRASRLENDFKVVGSDGRAVKGKYRTHGVGASIEAGRRFARADGWFVEPQAELAVFRAGGGSYRAANGLRVRDEGGSSVLGRLGLEAGKRIELAGGGQVQPYLKASVLQEFNGAGTVRTNGIAHRTELRGARAELGLGVAAALGRGHGLYASYEYSKGPKLAIPWTFHAGYRYSW